MKAAALLLSLAAALPAESHVALRSVSSVLRESPAEMGYYLPPAPPFQARIFPHDWDLTLEQSLRLYGGESLGAWRAEWNLLGLATETSEASLLPAEGLQDGRSRALEGWLRGRQDALKAEIDQLNLRWQGARASVIAGRQSVNLGVGFFFSPLDVFAPFSPLETYRDFRPGVDALRLAWSPGDYSVVELIAVAGYAADPVPYGGALPPPPDRLSLGGPDGQGSLLGRVQSNGGAWSLTLQGGRVRQWAEGGGAFQLEFWDASWLLEGDWRDDLREDNYGGWKYPVGTWNAGFSRQWSSWLSGRGEHGAAYTRLLRPDGSGGLNSILLRSALSLEAQATPLWTVSVLLLRTESLLGFAGSESSFQALLNADYSLSDESTLTLSAGAPILPSDAPYYADQWSPYRFSLALRTTL